MRTRDRSSAASPRRSRRPCSRSLAALAFAASAQASETIESFRTNAKEQNLQPPPEGLGEIVGTGYALGPPVAGNFEIETAEGAIDTVETTPSTTYQEPSVIKPRLEDIRQGFFVTIYGERTGPQLFASHVIITSPHAGGHPDLSTSFTLDDPGEPEAARNVIFNAPEGVFGNPNAITHCTSSDFALDQCPPTRRSG